MNVHGLAKLPVTLLFFTVFLSTISAAIAADSKYHQRVDDVDFYLAVIPAEITQEPSETLNRFKKHETRYHIIVSLFDSPSGRRIAGAKIHAIVSRLADMHERHKKLEPMLIMDAASYGNYFLMSKPGKYRLRFKMQTPLRKYETTAVFFFDRPKD